LSAPHRLELDELGRGGHQGTARTLSKRYAAPSIVLEGSDDTRCDTEPLRIPRRPRDEPLAAPPQTDAEWRPSSASLGWVRAAAVGGRPGSGRASW